MKKPTTLLCEEEIKILGFVAKFGVAHDKHILFHLRNSVPQNPIDQSNYNKTIKRLIKADYIVEHRLYKNAGAYLTLGFCASELLAAKAVKKLALNTLNHDMLVLDLYFDLLGKNPGCEILSERELRISSGMKVGDKKKVPDLLLTTTNGEQIAIEVEISEKSQARLIEIINNYVNDVKLYATHYFVTSEALGKKLLKLSGYHPKIRVFLLKHDTTSDNINNLVDTKLNSNTNIASNDLVSTRLITYIELKIELEDRVNKTKSPWSFDLDDYLNNREKYKKLAHK